MATALVLVDLQEDFLAAPGLEPAAGALVDRAAALLDAWRATGGPVVHVWTTVRRSEDRRMPHWQAAGLWRCEEGTPGHATPAPLRPRPGEPVVHKTDFDGFDGTTLAAVLADVDADAVVLAGTHLHACVRSTALGAYRRRLAVTVAQDAVGSDDPLHAAAATAWMAPRGLRFAPVADLLPAPGATAASRELVREDPARTGRVLWRKAPAGPPAVGHAVTAARAAAPGWVATDPRDRAALLDRLAVAVQDAAAELTALLVADVGKPVTQAREEVARTVALLHAVTARGGAPRTTATGPGSVREEVPLGTVALITPWNNPLAIPVGKLAPALVHGNAVVWKPAVPGTRVATRLAELLVSAGLPDGVLGLLPGGTATAEALLADGRLDGVTVTGGPALGWAARVACARHGIPLQAELGGNNPVLVDDDLAVGPVAAAVVAGAFDFAGQRCTAGRRVIVLPTVMPAFLDALRDATTAVAWGDPALPATTVGPLVDTAARDRVLATIDRAIDTGAVTVARTPDPGGLAGAYLAPTVLLAHDPASEIVQEETFGPVLVVQPARDWTHALALANGVRQGLAAAAFTGSPEHEAEFLRDARAGILKLGLSTAGADVEAPFGGWKHSGSGPPEHGEDNRSFYTRPRAVYRDVTA